MTKREMNEIYTKFVNIHVDVSNLIRELVNTVPDDPEPPREPGYYLVDDKRDESPAFFVEVKNDGTHYCHYPSEPKNSMSNEFISGCKFSERIIIDA